MKLSGNYCLPQILVFCVVLLFGTRAFSQHRIVFYNAENYFDARVDSTSTYNEYIPSSMRHWTYKRYADKRDKVYQVIAAVGGWKSPTIVAFAEIENRFVLEDLIKNTPLQNQNYEIIHFDSPDERGIDIGLIYLKDQFQPTYTKAIPIAFDSDPSNKTRDILYVKGNLENDSIHIFINHWPSRFGGMLETNNLRVTASKTLKKVCDSVCHVETNANIVILGDFNDELENASLQLLIAKGGCDLVNIPLRPYHELADGTLKYQGIWNSFDQIIVSECLLNSCGALSVKKENAYLFDPPFLLEPDNKYNGLKPFRTYSGFIYQGGFSDHLPVFVDIYSNKTK